jgi:hypothetical protein
MPASQRLLGSDAIECGLLPMPSPQNSAERDPLLTEVGAADLLSLSIRTLQAWRSKKIGPPFVRAGRAVRYRHSDLNEWVTGQTVRHGGAKCP